MPRLSLSRARKYKLNLTIAHQYIEQMEEEVRDAVFGNVGTMITFRVGAFDAEVLEKEFAPQFTAEDLVNLGIYQMYLKLMIDGVTSHPFSAKGMAPIARGEINFKEAVLRSSREQFAQPRAAVEKIILDWHAPEANREKKSPIPPLHPTSHPSATVVRPAAFQRAETRNEPPRSQTPWRNDNDRREQFKPDENKQAFMKAAEELRQKETTPEKREEPISLSDLKPQSKLAEEKKIPTQENIKSLKDALARVIKTPVQEKKLEEKKAPSPLKPNPQAKIESKPELKREEKPKPAPEPHNQNKNEVPEDVLRELLK